jgi:hypothetical protein
VTAAAASASQPERTVIIGSLEFVTKPEPQPSPEPVATSSQQSPPSTLRQVPPRSSRRALNFAEVDEAVRGLSLEEQVLISQVARSRVFPTVEVGTQHSPSVRDSWQQTASTSSPDVARSPRGTVTVSGGGLEISIRGSQPRCPEESGTARAASPSTQE